MATGKPIKTQSRQPLKLYVKQQFTDRLQTIEMLGATMFGKTAADKLHNEIRRRILMLPNLPKANPKFRFVKSTPEKEYRAILYEKFYVVYSVTKTRVTVLTIVHQSLSPKKLKKIK